MKFEHGRPLDGNHRKPFVCDDPLPKRRPSRNLRRGLAADRVLGGDGTPQWARDLQTGWFEPPKNHGWGL